MLRYLSVALPLVLACGSVDALETPLDEEGTGQASGPLDRANTATVTAGAGGGGGGEAEQPSEEEPGEHERIDGLPPCFGDLNNGDGTCTRTIYASPAPVLSGSMFRETQACPIEASIPQGPSPDSDVWYVVAYASNATSPLTKSRRNSYLSFDTTGLEADLVEQATLSLHHVEDAGLLDSVLLFAGATQPLFGEALDPLDFDVPDTLLGFASRGQIELHNAARWTVPPVQINEYGHTQLMVMLDRYCLNFGITSNYPANHWAHYSPTVADPAKRPTLVVTYRPRER